MRCRILHIGAGEYRHCRRSQPPSPALSRRLGSKERRRASCRDRSRCHPGTLAGLSNLHKHTGSTHQLMITCMEVGLLNSREQLHTCVGAALAASIGALAVRDSISRAGSAHISDRAPNGCTHRDAQLVPHLVVSSAREAGCRAAGLGRSHKQLTMRAGGRPTKGGHLCRAEADILTLGNGNSAGAARSILAGRVGRAILRVWQGEGHP